MTTTPLPDMPGFRRGKASKLRCPTHNLRLSLRQGRLMCPDGHAVEAKKALGAEPGGGDHGDGR